MAGHEVAESRVVGATWRWRHREEDRRAAQPGNVRVRSRVEAAIAAAVGILLLAAWHKVVAGVAVLCVAAFVLVSGQFVPPAYRGLKRLMGRVGRWTGIALSWVLLVPFFYLCFPLGRAVLAASGKDPMHRRFPGKEATFWMKRRPVAGPEHYRRQF
jgi:hypothetical protein